MSQAKEPRTFSDLAALSNEFREDRISLTEARQALVFFALNGDYNTVSDVVSDLFIIAEREGENERADMYYIVFSDKAIGPFKTMRAAQDYFYKHSLDPEEVAIYSDKICQQRLLNIPIEKP